LKTIDEAIEIFPYEPYSHMLKGNIYFNNEDYTEATKQYRKVSLYEINITTTISYFPYLVINNLFLGAEYSQLIGNW